MAVAVPVSLPLAGIVRTRIGWVFLFLCPLDGRNLPKQKTTKKHGQNGRDEISRTHAGAKRAELAILGTLNNILYLHMDGNIY